MSLGSRSLTDIIENSQSNSRTWLMTVQRAEMYSVPSQNALAEAWEWMHYTGLIAEDLVKQGEHMIFVTRLGHEVARTGKTARLRANARLSLDLHGSLAEKVRPQFLMGEYEMAAFAAMRAVEVRVREMSKSPPSLIGVPLMNKAFGNGGPLVDSELEPGEQDARRNLFVGAIGTIKNPTSHREVHYEDVTEASEAVLLADLLMRILDRVPAKRVGPEG